MIKYFLLLLSLTGALFAQTLTVSGTVNNTDGTALVGGVLSATLVNSSGVSYDNLPYQATFSAISQKQAGTILDSNGTFSLGLSSNSLINGSQWSFKICSPNANLQCGIYQASITSSTNIGTALGTALSNVLDPNGFATIAYVLAHGGGGATIPATVRLYKGNGAVNGVIEAVPGTDYQSPIAYTLSNFSTLGAALTQIATDTGGTTPALLIVPASTSLTASATIAANVTLNFQSGAPLNCPSGSPTITINGPIIAGEFQTWNTNCTINLATNNSIFKLSASWWGVLASAMDNSTAMTAAHTAMFVNARGKTLTFPAGTFSFATQQTIYTGNRANGISIEGTAGYKTILNYTGAQISAGAYVMSYDSTGSAPLNNVQLKNLVMTGGGTAQYAAQFINIGTNKLIENVVFGKVDETNTSSACALFYNLTATNMEQPICSSIVSAFIGGSATWGTHIPHKGFVFDGISPAVGTTVVTVINPRVESVTDEAIHLGNGSNIIIDEFQEFGCAKSFIIDSGWSNAIINGGNIGEQDSNTTEDMTSAGTGITFNGVNFLSAYPIHLTGGSSITFNDGNLPAMPTSLVIDASVQHVNVKASVKGAIQDSSNDARSENLYNLSSTALKVNTCTNQFRLNIGGSGGEIPNNPMLCTGTWYASSTAPTLVSSVSFDPSVTAWRAFFNPGKWLKDALDSREDSNSYGQTELNQTVNTFTFQDGTVWTFSLNSSHQLQIASSSATVHGYVGELDFFPVTIDTTVPNLSISVPGAIKAGPATFTNPVAGETINTAKAGTSGSSASWCLASFSAVVSACIKTVGNGQDLEFFTETSNAQTPRLTIPPSGGPAVWTIGNIMPSLTIPSFGSSTSPICTTTGGLFTNSGCSGGGTSFTVGTSGKLALVSTVLDVTAIVPATNLANAFTAVQGLNAGSTGGNFHGTGANAIPTCNSAANGLQVTVIDATTNTFGATYVQGGTHTSALICNESAVWVVY